MKITYDHPTSLKIFGLVVLALAEFYTYKFLVWTLHGCVEDRKHVTLGMIEPVQQGVGIYWFITFVLIFFFSFSTYRPNRRNILFKIFCSPWAFIIGLFILCYGLQGYGAFGGWTNNCF